MDDAFANFTVDRFRYLIDKIDSQHFTDFFCRHKLDEALLKKLKRSMLIIVAVLHDNERKRRFRHLGEVMLDLESLLDVADAESSLLSFGAKSQPNTNQTGISISSEFTSLGKSKDQYQQQMESIAEKLEFIVKESLQTTRNKQYLQLPAATDCSNDEFEVIGRDADKEAIIELLLADDVSADQIDVIAITGTGGVGKTTLAQLIYEDVRVRDHFDFKAWISVPEEFDVFRLTKTILEALVTSQLSDVEDLNSLQARLKESLDTEKFLLVLDNFGCDNYSDWETLQSTLSAGRTKRSKIIVTTGISELAAMTGNVYAYHLKTLNYEDSWMLFAKHASANNISSLHPQLEEIGKEIVKSKCFGLPLVAKVVGAALSFKPTVKIWNFVLKFSPSLSDFLDDTSSILLALMFSYHYLPTHLKLCFAACEIFPRGYEFEEEEVILIWMATGLLPQREHKSMEEVGHDYFFDLTSRCFFQRSSANRSRFVLHDLLNHLTHLVSGDRPSRLVHPQSLIASRKARKIGSLSSSGVIKFVQSLRNLTFRNFSLRPSLTELNYGSRSLEHLGLPLLPDLTGVRSLLELEELPSNLPDLEMLSLSHLPDLTGVRSLLKLEELPLSLQHLEMLPLLPLSELTGLRSLQLDLSLSDCNLLQPPADFIGFRSLEILNLSDCNLTQLPADLSGSPSLEFVDVSHCRSIIEFPDLTVRLPNSFCRSIGSPDLEMLSLSHRRITELPEWIGRLRKLRGLDLSHTAITMLPASVGDLSNLETLKLSNCPSLTELPTTTRKLVNLRRLLIDGTGLKEMPEDMGKLKNLHTLSNFIVGKYGGSQIKELGPLSNLQGTLHVSELQNVVFATDASEADLKNKKNLDVLELEWSNTNTQVDSQNETKVLEQLQPHKTLKELSITFFSGTRFPNWLGDYYFSEMVFLQLSNCNNCLYLPPVGQLPSLEYLIVEEMNTVERVGTEFYGVNYPSVMPFQSLKMLVFRGMLEWQEWISPEGIEFPCLQMMCIRKCPKLKKCLPKCLLSTNIEISECPELEMTPPRLPIIDDMQLHDADKEEFEGNEKLVDRPPRLTVIEELKSLDSNVVQLKSDHEFALQCSEHRTDVSIASHISSRESFKLLPENPSIKHEGASFDSDGDDLIDIWYSPDILHDISSPISLKVSEISQLEELPPRLHSLKIEGCDALKSLPQEVMCSSPHLQHLYIIDCCYLELFQEGHLPLALKSLYIRNCRKLDFLSLAETKHEHALLEHLCMGSSCDSLRCFPLTFFPKLGSLSIWDSANFDSISITKNHMSLHAIEIRDCQKLLYFPKGGLLTPNLTSILLSNCKNLKVLPDQLYRLTSLQSLLINECPELDSIPEGGFPCSLDLLRITSCNKLTPCTEWGMNKLNSLSCFEIEGGCRDLESFPEEKLLPNNLKFLRISRASNLKFLDYKGLEHLESLETLEINCCDKLQSLPEKDLPSSLTFLYIKECPLLESKLQNRRGKEWYKISHIPNIQMD